MTSKEEWRDVVGYEGLYKISSTGRVLSKQGGWKERTPQMLKSVVICLETGKEFESARQATIWLGLSGNAVAYCCNGKNNTAGKLHWKYKE